MASSRIDQIVSRLKSQDSEIRSEAIKEFQRLVKSGLTIDEGIQALYAASSDFPNKGDRWDDPSSWWVLALADNPYREYVPVIQEIFPKLSHSAKGWTLRLLGTLNSRQASILLLELLQDLEWASDFDYVVFLPLHLQHHHGEIFFPKLLEYAAKPHIESEIYSLTLEYLQANKIESSLLLPYAEQILMAYLVQRENLIPLQKWEGVGWMWEDTYQSSRGKAGVLLDLLGYVPTPSIRAELHRALGYTDPKLKFFAAMSLLRLGEPFSLSVFEEIAASAEVRHWLFAGLEKRNQLYFIPDEFQTQAALAESDMVNWLTFGTELGRAPDEIELMQIISIPIKEFHETLEYYLFRFRTFPPHWSAKDGWMAGISGPFLRGERPRPYGYGETFSTFAPWDSKTPQEHVGNIRDLMDRWREYRDSQKETDDALKSDSEGS